MATMHDAVYASNIPADAELVAGYVDGNFAWPASDWDRFPHATKVRITINPSLDDGDMLDIEPGNWDPEDAPAWVAMRRKSGHPNPGVYTMGSWWQRCKQAFADQGIPEGCWWIADWDGDPHVPAGAVAKQYANGSMLGTGYDLSVTVDGWPHGMEDEMASSAEMDAFLRQWARLTGDNYTRPQQTQQTSDNENYTLATVFQLAENFLDDIYQPPQGGSDTNPCWTPASVLQDMWNRQVAMEKQVSGLLVAVTEIAKAKSVDAGVADEIVAKVKAALDSVTVTLDTDGGAS